MQLSRLRPLNLSSLLGWHGSASLCSVLYSGQKHCTWRLKHHPAESVTSDFFTWWLILRVCIIHIADLSTLTFGGCHKIASLCLSAHEPGVVIINVSASSKFYEAHTLSFFFVFFASAEHLNLRTKFLLAHPRTLHEPHPHMQRTAT